MGFRIIDDKVIGTDADTAQTKLIESASPYTWGLFVKWSGVTGAGSVDVEGSANGVDWFVIETAAVSGATGTTTETADVNPWNYLRVAHKVGTLSAGRVEAWFNAKGQ